MERRDLAGRAAGVLIPVGRTAAVMAAAIGFMAWLCGAAIADPNRAPVGVIELFTSQGCSSCPPADSIFSELVKRGDLVALAYHVDYWDYLGWRDTFARPENTDRQYDYMKAFGTQSVYTPQAVINGLKHVNGAKKPEIDHALRQLKAGGNGLSVKVRATKQGSSLRIEADAAPGHPVEAEVLLISFNPPTPVEIEQGENHGKVVTYWNAVTDVRVAGMWHGKAASFELPMREVAKNAAGGYAVLLQRVDREGSPGPILGATMIREPAN